MKAQIKAFGIKAFFYIGVFGWVSKFAFYYQVIPAKLEEKAFPPFYIKRRKNQNIQVLAYHRVTDEKGRTFTPTSTENFDRQMEFLAENYSVISAEESIQRLIRKDIPPNCVVVTLDDGYRDNFTHAFPILGKYGTPATIFLATGCLNGQETLWHDQICFAFNNTLESKLNLKDFNGEEYELSKLEDYELALTRVLWRLREITNEERTLWTKVVRERLGFFDNSKDGGRERLMLNLEELENLRDGGISIGAHTVTHPILSQISLAAAKEEISHSKWDIESKLNIRVETFAYPSGRRVDFNEGVKLLVKEEGFSGAFSMIYGVNESEEDRFELRRIPIGNWDIPYFAKELIEAKI